MGNTPKYRQEWILEILKQNNKTTHKECFGEYAVRYGKSEKTFDKDWKVAKKSILQYKEKVKTAVEKASIAVEVKAVKNGLKTKFDRVMFYQNQIELMEKQLTGEEKLYFIVGNKPVVNPNSKGEYILPIEKQNEIRKQIKEYQIEISKIEGDYEKHNDQKTPKQNLTMAKVKMVIKERNNL